MLINSKFTFSVLISKSQKSFTFLVHDLLINNFTFDSLNHHIVSLNDKLVEEFAF